MCGIAGIAAFDASIDAALLGAIAGRMSARLSHRGPDGEGVWISPDGKCALAHRRLAIVDAHARSDQPLEGARADVSTALSFNGEIYNFEALKAREPLCRRRFATSGDSEVLLAGLDARGLSFVEELDAMYAFAYWDGEALHLARDRFGEKPLYYFVRGAVVCFASELQAFYEVPGFDDRVERGTIALYCAFHQVPAPHSIYAAVKKLEPAATLTVRAKSRHSIAVQLHQRRRFLHQPRQRALAGADAADRLDDLLEKAVRTRLWAGGPVGAFLSAGVDSATLVAIAAKRLGASLNTYSIGFDDHDGSEHRLAGELAAQLGLKHSTRKINRDDVEGLSGLVEALDEPHGDSSCIVTALLAQKVGADCKVVLTGDGGDELFGGYARYQQAHRRALSGADLGDPGACYLNDFLVFPDAWIGRLFDDADSEICRHKLGDMRARADDDDVPLVDRLRRLDSDDYLPGVLAKVDRMSMRYGVEVRSPFLSVALADFAETLAPEDCLARGGKGLLKTVADRYLPAHWCDRPKQGFGLPMDEWLGAFMGRACREILLSKECRLAAWISPLRLRRALEAPMSTPQLWTLYSLERWLRTHPASPPS